MPTITPEFISKTLVQLASAIIGLLISFGIHLSNAEKAAILSLTVLLIPGLVEVGWLLFRGHAAAASTSGSRAPPASTSGSTASSTTPADTSAGGSSAAA